MLVWVRKLLENWIARGFFALLVVVFVFWGVSNVITLIGSDTAIAHIGGQPVDISLVQEQYQRLLTQAEQNGQTQPDLPARQQLAAQALAAVIRQAVLRSEEAKLGIRVPDAQIRQLVDAIAAFQANGVFSQAVFTQVLAQNNTSPDQFIGEVKDNLANRQLLGAAIAGAAPPGALVTQIFDYETEQRIAETVTIADSAQTAPPPPSETQLQRYWRNHPRAFTAPQYRRVQLVILAPALLAPHEAVAAADVQAAYARVQAAAPSQPVRSVQVIVAGDIAAESRLAAAWKRGASWAEMQAMAPKFGANAVALTQATAAQIPAAALANAVFAAAPGQVSGPVAGSQGLYIFKVTDIGSSGPDQASLMAQITQALQLQKAQAEVAQDVDRLQDALAGQTPLDQLPGNLGLVALQGTLDADGDTPQGGPAPLPGGADLRAAILKAAFATAANTPAQLTNGPGGSYFALDVAQVIAPARSPYTQIRPQVLRAWTADAVSRAAEVKAANLLAAVQSGQSLDAAASAGGAAVSVTPPFTRQAPAAGMDPQMGAVMFSLKPGEAAMLQTKTGFTVAAVLKSTQPGPADDPADYTQVSQGLAKQLQDDVGESLLAGMQNRDNVSVNQKLLAQIYQ